MLTGEADCLLWILLHRGRMCVYCDEGYYWAFGR
jgi:hypothetical protein